MTADHNKQRRGRWHLEDLIEEASRRLRQRDLLLAAFCCLLAAGVVTVSGLDLARGVRAAQAQLAAGVSAFMVEPLDLADPLEPARCEAMANSSSVMASGTSFGENIGLIASWQPSGLELPLWDLSLGALRVWWPQAPATGGIFVGQDLAAVRGVGAGAVISINGQELVVTGVLPESVRPAEWQASMVRVVAPFGQANLSQCWYRMERAAIGSAEETAQAAFPNGRYLLTPYYRTDELTSSPSRLILEGSGRWVWLAALAAAFVLITLIALMNRRESAIYRTTGSRRIDLYVMAQAKALIVVVLPACLGALLAVALMVWRGVILPSPSALWYTMQPACLLVAALTVLVPLVDLVCSATSVTNSLKQ
jgi:hypothetical protein